MDLLLQKKAQEAAEERKSPARFEWVKKGQAVDMNARADIKRDEAILKLKRLRIRIRKISNPPNSR